MNTLDTLYLCSGRRQNTDKAQFLFVKNQKYNYEPKIKKIKFMLSIWKQRRLSLKGKITVLNYLPTSILVHPRTILETSDNVKTEIDKI